MLSALGMLLAIIATLFVSGIKDYSVIIIGMIIGSALGAVMAYTVKMTAMPQMVGILNGFGGGASALVAAAEFFKYVADPSTLTPDVSVSIMLAMVVGASDVLREHDRRREAPGDRQRAPHHLPVPEYY
jgi:NAD(P) transhydrogenase subunit beta